MTSQSPWVEGNMRKMVQTTGQFSGSMYSRASRIESQKKKGSWRVKQTWTRRGRNSSNNLDHTPSPPSRGLAVAMPSRGSARRQTEPDPEEKP